MPQICKCGFRHIGMAEDAVRLADQLLAAPCAHGNESLVGMGDDAVQIGARSNQFAVGEFDFLIQNIGLVIRGMPVAAGKGLGRITDKNVRIHAADSI